MRTALACLVVCLWASSVSAQTDPCASPWPTSQSIPDNSPYWFQFCAPVNTASSARLYINGVPRLPDSIAMVQGPNSAGMVLYHSVGSHLFPVGTYPIEVGVMGATGAEVARTGALTLTVGQVTPPPPNQPPIVYLTSPVSGSTVPPLQDVTLIAQASDPDGSIASVQVFMHNGTQGDNISAPILTPPYSVTWRPPVGNYRLWAVAIDTLGAMTRSADVLLTVATAPANTLTILPKICTIADASKPDARTGWGVQFAVDGVLVGGRDTSAPYSRDFPYTPGSHVGTATWTKTGVPAVVRTVTVQGCQ